MLNDSSRVSPPLRSKLKVRSRPRRSPTKVVKGTLETISKELRSGSGSVASLSDTTPRKHTAFHQIAFLANRGAFPAGDDMIGP
jgi:hypothetical protein